MPDRRSNTVLPIGGRSLLSGPQRVWMRAGLSLALFMMANTLYLLFSRLADAVGWRFFAGSETSLPKLFQVAILTHTGAGLLMACLLLVFAGWHLRANWIRRRGRSLVTGIGLVGAGLILAISGLLIMTEANSRDNAWIWWTHVACGALAATLYLIHRWTSVVRPTRVAARRVGVVVAALTVLLLVGHGLSAHGPALSDRALRARETGRHTGPGSRLRDPARHARDAFVPAAFVPPESPFFPSAATTSTGDYVPASIITRGDTSGPDQLGPDLDRYGFVVNERIGAEQCARCHADTVEQWASSAHRFASFNNPFYEAAINALRESTAPPNEWVRAHMERFPKDQARPGMVASKFCSGCHEPALMLPGAMDAPVDRRSVEAQAGLTCLACHAIDKIHNVTGNGNYNIADEQEDPYVFSKASDGITAFLHDTALKAKPRVHKTRMLRPFFREAEFCAACHKVNLDQPINNYRWLRGQDEYDAWHDSGVAHNASRTFYLPPSPSKCQDCHMPFEPAPLGDVSARNGMVRSHRFLAVNTALPFVRGDQKTIGRIESFLRGRLRVDVFALRPEGSERTVCALDRTRPVLTAGETVQVEIVVRNAGVGHTFPGGTNDSNEAWLEVTLLDDRDQVLASIGQVREDGYVDPAAHFYRAVLLDREGRPIRRRNGQDIHVPAYVNVIGPGTADVARFKMDMPVEQACWEVTIRARLLWRKFDRAYTEFAYRTNPEGFKLFDHPPDLPITELATDQVTLSVRSPRDRKPAKPTEALPADWMRFNDYGIGLLLQGDTRGAAEAFAFVARIDPARIDGPRNLARAAIRDGNLAEAYRQLRACEKISPGDARTAYFWGQALQEDGRYAEAVAAYGRVLERFPNDRAAWRNLGRTLYLNGDYDQALEAFGELLRIDPESRTGHYHRMLIFKATDRPDQARLAETAYEKYRIDESAQEITLAYRRSHPADNLEAQPVHVHRLVPRSADSPTPAVPSEPDGQEGS